MVKIWISRWISMRAPPSVEAAGMARPGFEDREFLQLGAGDPGGARCMARKRRSPVNHGCVSGVWNAALEQGGAGWLLHAAFQARMRFASVGRARLASLMRAALGVVVLAGLGFAAWHYFAPPGGQVFATTLGSHRIIKLADGSRIELNTDTVARVDVTATRRLVSLEKGEAYFEIVHDPVHPLVVLAGKQRITDLGTKFSVRANGDQIGSRARRAARKVRYDGWPCAAAGSAHTRRCARQKRKRRCRW